MGINLIDKKRSVDSHYKNTIRFPSMIQIECIERNARETFKKQKKNRFEHIQSTQ